MRLQTILLAAGLVLAGCATPREADLRLPQGYESPSEAASAPPSGAIALDTWWTAYGDPQLTELVQQALERNPDVRTARARLDEVRGQRSEALYRYLPQGDFMANGRQTHTEQIGGTAANIPGFSTSGTSEQYQANFNVSWEVDPWGRGFVAYKVADAEVARARFAWEAARAQIAAQTAEAYFQARGLAIQLADTRETARIQRDLYNVAARRAAAGVAPTSEPDRIAGDLAQAEANVAALEAQLQTQKRALLILAGRVFEPTANIAVPPEVGDPPAIPASLPSELLQRRPDVRQAQSAVRSAAGQQRLAGLAFFPSFTLSPGYGWARIEQPNFTSETTAWFLAGSAMQPLLSIPRLMAELKAQNARTEQAVTAYEKTVQTAFQEAEAALVTLDADRRRVVLLREGEARSRRAYQAARIGYDRGLTDLTSTLSAEQAWRGVRTQFTAAQVQALRRSVQAMKAIGGGWPAQAYAAK